MTASGRDRRVRVLGLALLLASNTACYPKFDVITSPTFAVGSATDAQIRQGLDACITHANAVRRAAYDTHKSASVSRRIAAIATILSGSGVTAASAAGKKNLATSLGVATILSGIVTAALNDDASTTAAEAAQQQSLTQLGSVRVAFARYQTADAATKDAARAALMNTLIECSSNPTPALITM